MGSKTAKGRTEKGRRKPGSSSQPSGESAPAANPLLATAVAWIVPGAGHFLLGRRGRGVAFFLLVTASIAIGWHLDGKLPWQWSGSPLATLATLGSLGMGLPYFVLRFGLDYEGVLQAPGYEYGYAFLLTAGLMNLLLMLDAWDVAAGVKE